MQKLLIQKDRSAAKRAQDVLYIHDTIELFGAALPTLKALWDNSIQPTLPAKTARNVIALSSETFSEVTDVIRDAARIPQDRTLSAERLRAACQLGLMSIVGA